MSYYVVHKLDNETHIWGHWDIMRNQTFTGQHTAVIYNHDNMIIIDRQSRYMATIVLTPSGLDARRTTHDGHVNGFHAR